MLEFCPNLDMFKIRPEVRGGYPDTGIEIPGISITNSYTYIMETVISIPGISIPGSISPLRKDLDVWTFGQDVHTSRRIGS